MPRKPLAPWAGNLLLVAASLAFLTFVVGILELGLRAVGLGDPDPTRTSRLGYQQLRLPVLEPGTRPDGEQGSP